MNEPMTAGAVSSTSTAAMAAGLRMEIQTRVLRAALDTADLVSEQLDAAFDAIEAQAAGLTEAGVVAARHDLVGEFVDVTG